MIVSLIIGLIIIAVVYWLVTLIPVPVPPWLFQVIFGLIAVLYVLDAFGIYHTGISFPIR